MAQIYLTAIQIDGAVRKLYSKNGYVVLSEVRNGTGYARRTVRTADMVAVSTWPSRGLFLEGIEIKSDKYDLQRELERPEKADAMAGYCRLWWLACAEGLTDGLMIPPNWGVITVDKKLVAKVSQQAKSLEPKPMDELLVCSILRNFAEGYIPRTDLNPLLADAREAERIRAQADIGHRHKQLEKAVTEFQDASGIEILSPNGYASWELGRIGEAVKILIAMKNKPLEEIRAARDSMKAMVECIDTALGLIGK